ncbi:membrane peptidoglycan carboxypeptidase [Sediminihabitans luteus]|uniref:Membrane peptidoglycan carboxypeptidase n=1 Tax=Sediminihabitans luteus TaxID=1138585 RepID=A0A2M9CEJ7_9CELL|nr:transglycosylase domain-containing protein [Sediminihabitans luteus]PJJ70309.1 membrane peptidoglycan carboxypeptidase [Sediminihabitans luteus]GII97780.1 carboxypeptidase [Sediminihabitans luteus]
MASSARSHGRHVTVFQLVALLLALVLVAGIGGILAGGLLIPVAAGTKTLADSAVQVFDDLPDDLEPGPLSQQSVIYANDGKTVIARYWTENRIVVGLDEVSQPMKDAVIATEDKRFWEHGGVDITGTTRAFVNNFSGGDVEGASTLTQQYVKNVLIEQAVRDDDPLAAEAARAQTNERKLREAKLAIALEKKMTKPEILEAYLNISQFGNGVYGVETAARYFFGKHAKDLNITESATIAGITKGPSAYDPTISETTMKNATGRRNTVLNLMYQQNYITLDQFNTARTSKLEDTLDLHPVEAGCAASQQYAFFCDYVTKEIVAQPAFGETAKDRQDLLYRGGLSIVTTVDPTMQKAAYKDITEAVPADDPSTLEAAISSVEPGTGKILAMAQNRPYNPAATDNAEGTVVNYSADMAHGASDGFQVGSNFKPFVLAEWLRSGHTLNETVNANKVPRNPSWFDTGSCSGPLADQEWTIANSEGNISGNVSVLKATAQSINTAFVDMGSKLKLCNIRDTAWDSGFRPSNAANPTVDDIELQAPMIIGTGVSSPLQMAAAYATFASGGTYCTPIAITKVTDADGKDLAVPGQDCEQSLDPKIANTVAYAMKGPLAPGGTAPHAALDRPAAGKTGTTQMSAQTWFTGYTPDLSTSVWVGSAEGNKQFNMDTTVKGVRYAPLYGSSIAAPTWHDFMTTALEGVPARDFAAPDPTMVGKPKPAYTPPADDDKDSDDGDKGKDSDNGSDKGGDKGGDAENTSNTLTDLLDDAASGQWDADLWGDGSNG